MDNFIDKHCETIFSLIDAKKEPLTQADCELMIDIVDIHATELWSYLDDKDQFTQDDVEIMIQLLQWEIRTKTSSKKAQIKQAKIVDFITKDNIQHVLKKLNENDGLLYGNEVNDSIKSLDKKAKLVRRKRIRRSS